MKQVLKRLGLLNWKLLACLLGLTLLQPQGSAQKPDLTKLVTVVKFIPSRLPIIPNRPIDLQVDFQSDGDNFGQEQWLELRAYALKPSDGEPNSVTRYLWSYDIAFDAYPEINTQIKREFNQITFPFVDSDQNLYIMLWHVGSFKYFGPSGQVQSLSSYKPLGGELFGLKCSGNTLKTRFCTYQPI
jgi:hypothetical protein